MEEIINLYNYIGCHTGDFYTAWRNHTDDENSANPGKMARALKSKIKEIKILQKPDKNFYDGGINLLYKHILQFENGGKLSWGRSGIYFLSSDGGK